MESRNPVIEASRIVVVMPNWLGDGVMATPFLRALRGLYPEAFIIAIARPLVAPVVRADNEDAIVNLVHEYKKGEEGKTARWIRSQNCDLGILLPNSFRS